jgi:hypothetical protein
MLRALKVNVPDKLNSRHPGQNGDSIFLFDFGVVTIGFGCISATEIEQHDLCFNARYFLAVRPDGAGVVHSDSYLLSVGECSCRFSLQDKMQRTVPLRTQNLPRQGKFIEEPGKLRY